MKKIVGKIFIFIIFIILSSTLNIKLDNFFMYTIYSVSGIMFSIGIGLIVTFNINGIKDKQLIIGIRKNIKFVRNSFILYFIISTAAFITDYYLRSSDIPNNKIHSLIGYVNIDFDISIFLLLIMLYSIAYYILNLMAIQKLNNDIFDRVNDIQ